MPLSEKTRKIFWQSVHDKSHEKKQAAFNQDEKEFDAIVRAYLKYRNDLDDLKGVRVVVCGLATNICCFYAARDLRKEGFRGALVVDASAGIDVPAANLFQQQTKEEGQRLGIEYTTVEAISTR